MAAMTDSERLVGITTTVPVEAIFAAGLIPVDLNNLFVSHPRPDELVERALEEGFPQGSCAWLKGIFGAVAGEGGPGRVVGVVRGDCNGTEVLLEALEVRGVEVIPFAYPLPASRDDLARELERFCGALGTTLEAAETWKARLQPVRDLLAEADRLCWRDNRLTGLEAHRWLVASSDFEGDPEEYGARLGAFIDEAAGRTALDSRSGLTFAREVRLGYLGVPPITTEIFEWAESLGARFVFHEVQRQFSMPGSHADLVDQYLAYTYPYSVRGRAADINRESGLRRLDGLFHYVQSFCHRNMEDVIFSRLLERPMLTVECDCPGTLSATAKARLENFIQVLGENLS
jgi:benzoyl-CoA reductase/2-hydroxyglutaryl-CoA dehydratase subunit BcrC/BadD/HgdB